MGLVCVVRGPSLLSPILALMVVATTSITIRALMLIVESSWCRLSRKSEIKRWRERKRERERESERETLRQATRLKDRYNTEAALTSAQKNKGLEGLDQTPLDQNLKLVSTRYIKLCVNQDSSSSYMNYNFSLSG